MPGPLRVKMRHVSTELQQLVTLQGAVGGLVSEYSHCMVMVENLARAMALQMAVATSLEQLPRLMWLL